MDQAAYAAQINPINLEGIDMTNETASLTEEVHAQILTLLGAMSWLIQTRMDIAIYVPALQRVSKSPQFGHVIRANKLVTWKTKTSNANMKNESKDRSRL